MPEAAAKPRSFADDLRRRTTNQIQRMLDARPDLLDANIGDIGGLAAVAADALSVGRAMDDLNVRQLAVIELLAALPDPFSRELALAAAQDDIGGEIDEFWARGLLWGSDDLHLVRFARDAFGPFPCRLAPPMTERKPFLTRWIDEPDSLATVTSSLPEAARDLLFNLATSGPTLSYAGALNGFDEHGPCDDIQLLLSRHLLVAVDNSTVVIPREVALPLRDHRWLVQGLAHTNESFTEVAQADESAAARAYGTVRGLTTLVDALYGRSIRIARGRTLVKADVDSLAEITRRPAVATHSLLLIGVVSGLLGVDPAEPDALVLTPQARQWRHLDVTLQWYQLCESWLNRAGVAAVMAATGVTDPDRLTSRQVQSADVLVAAAVAAMSVAPAGGAVASAGETGWYERLRPRLDDLAVEHAQAWMRIAETLGLVYRGCVPSFARTASRGDRDGAETEFGAALAPEIDTIYVQPDNSIIVPGRPARSLLEMLMRFADIENEDSALLARVSPTSINRALYSGLTSRDVITFLERTSQTPLGQPLAYMLEDQQRRFGSLKAVSTSTVLVASDESETTRILQDARLTALHLRRVAPMVLCSDADVALVTELMREAGHTPLAEGTSVGKPDTRAAGATGIRLVAAPTETRQLSRTLAAALTGSFNTASVETEQLGVHPEFESMTLAERISVAHSGHQLISVVYTESDGSLRRAQMRVVHIGEGFITFYEASSGAVRTIATSRITSIA